MSELLAPKAVGEDVTLLNHFGRRIVKRIFEYPHGLEGWMLWGGKGAPAIIFPVTDQREVVALWQFRHAPTPPRFLLELPGGNPESIEKSEETARNELVKETGFTAEIFRVIGDEIWFDPASCFTPFVPVLATGCRKVGEPELERTEIMEVRLFSIPDWVNKIYSGEIRDSKSIAVTFLALPGLGYRVTRTSE